MIRINKINPNPKTMTAMTRNTSVPPPNALAVPQALAELTGADLGKLDGRCTAGKTTNTPPTTTQANAAASDDAGVTTGPTPGRSRSTGPATGRRDVGAFVATTVFLLSAVGCGDTEAALGSA